MPAYAADLLSDTLTRPTPAMREAMARAEVGDDVFGEDPDPPGARGARVAALLGHEAGLFSLTGSLANQPASGSTSRRGRSSSPTSRRTSCAPSWAQPRSPASPAGPGRPNEDYSSPARCRRLRPASGRTRSRPHSSSWRTRTTSAGVRSSRSRRSARCGRPPRELGVVTSTGPGCGTPTWRGVSLTAYGEQFDTVSVRLSKGSAPRSGACSWAPPSRWRRPWSGGSATAPGCVRSASSPPPAYTPSTTTSSGWPTTTPAPLACQCLRRCGARQRGCRHGGDEHRRPRWVRPAGRRRSSSRSSSGTASARMPPGRAPSGTSTSTTPARPRPSTPRRLCRVPGPPDARRPRTSAARGARGG